MNNKKKKQTETLPKKSNILPQQSTLWGSPPRILFLHHVLNHLSVSYWKFRILLLLNFMRLNKSFIITTPGVTFFLNGMRFPVKVRFVGYRETLKSYSIVSMNLSLLENSTCGSVQVNRKATTSYFCLRTPVTVMRSDAFMYIRGWRSKDMLCDV